MKRYWVFILAALMCLSLSHAYERVWARYDLIDTGNDVTRSIAWDPVGDHVYVATRINDNPSVIVLDPGNGATVDTLQRPEGGYSGGVYPLNMVSVDGDGAVYVCNLSVPAINAADMFKIYKYADKDAEPQVVFENALEGKRFGDSFSVCGKGENVHIYASGMGNDKLAVLTAGPDSLSLETMLVLPGMGAARHGISPVEAGGDLWINGTDATTFPVNLLDAAGNVKAVVPDSLIASGSSTVLNWKAGSMNVLTVANPFLSNTLRSVQYEVYSDALGDTYTFDFLGNNSDSLLFAYEGTTLNNNINGSASLAYDTTRHRLYVVMGVNSVAAVDLNPVLQIASPRDHGYFTIQVDGVNEEYTNYDRIATSGDRKLYTNWSGQLMYLALSGNSLYASYQSQQLYIAFDTEPEGDNGSTEPPTADGGVAALPFAADVVIRFDSDTSPLIDLSSGDPSRKWTGGTVYKYNSGAWNSSDIDGFDINYGAMAVVGDGNDSLITEIAIAKTAAGIGENPGALKFMLYLVEEGSGGDVLAAFPVSNSGPEFSDYYVLDSLGTGQLPRRCIRLNGSQPVSVSPHIPDCAGLEANYPNPFNPVTRIGYSLSHDAAAQILLYDLTGKKVATLVNRHHKAGSYEISFDASSLPGGIYFYRLLQNGKTVQTRKMLLIK